MDQQHLPTQKGASPVRPPEMIAAIDHVLDLCRQAQSGREDASLPHVIDELGSLRKQIVLSWPLPAKLKRQIDLGPFATKNIEDWNEELARTLMSLDHSLQHDGARIYDPVYSDEPVREDEPSQNESHGATRPAGGDRMADRAARQTRLSSLTGQSPRTDGS